MNSGDPWSAVKPNAGLLIDTSLLVLFIVGTVNPGRIETFKRTSGYAREDYELLVRILDGFHPLYTLAHLLSEVSSLTDLTGRERLQARHLLKQHLDVLDEPEMPSRRAAQDASLETLGLTDAGIATPARDTSRRLFAYELVIHLL